MTAVKRRLATAILELGIVILPVAYRPRYRVELAGELAEIPKQQQVAYALRVLLHSFALRSALTRYRPTIGEDLMASKPSPYNTSVLHHRQEEGDVGHTVLGEQGRVTSRKRWKLVRVPAIMMLVGIVLGLWGPLPGLGAFLMMGGAMALTVGAIAAFNDYFS